MTKLFLTSLQAISLATALCASVASAAVSLDTLIDSAQSTTIEPITYRSLPVAATPEAICSLAGYQVATDFAKQELGSGTEYYEINGQGWGGTGFISSVAIGKGVVPKGGGGYYALKKVTCRRKVKSADIVFD
jgi:ABC-type Fe3+-hydroxamate transport system substrate-binding protein